MLETSKGLKSQLLNRPSRLNLDNETLPLVYLKVLNNKRYYKSFLL